MVERRGEREERERAKKEDKFGTDYQINELARLGITESEEMFASVACKHVNSLEEGSEGRTCQ